MISSIQKANTFWSVNFMRCDTQHVNCFFLDIYIEQSKRLHRIGMKISLVFFEQAAYRRNGLYHTRFIVHIHNRSEEHTSELQSRFALVCRLLLDNKMLTYI